MSWPKSRKPTHEQQRECDAIVNRIDANHAEMARLRKLFEGRQQHLFDTPFDKVEYYRLKAETEEHLAALSAWRERVDHPED